MSEIEEPMTWSPAMVALLQVGAAAGVGTLVLPFGFGYFVLAGWSAGGGAAPGSTAVFVAVATGLLVVVASLVPEASRLTRTMVGRVGWALIVVVVGTTAWFFAFSMYPEVEGETDSNAMLAFPFSGVPYALAAGLLLRRRSFKLGALALIVASVVGLLVVRAGTVPSEADAWSTAVNR